MKSGQQLGAAQAAYTTAYATSRRERLEFSDLQGLQRAGVIAAGTDAGIDHPGSDFGDLDAVTLQLDSQAAGECRQGVLGSAIDHAEPVDLAGRDRGHDDDVAATSLHHRPCHRYPNARTVECCEWQCGTEYSQERRNDEITILANCSYGTLEGDVGNSAGIQGIQFSSIAGKIYERARELGLGMELPRDMFLQDMPT